MNDGKLLRNYLMKAIKLLDQDPIKQSTETNNGTDNKEGKSVIDQTKEEEGDSNFESAEDEWSITDQNEVGEDAFASEISSSKLLHGLERGNDEDFIECHKKLGLLQKSLHSFEKSFHSLMVNRIGIYRLPTGNEDEEQVEPAKNSHDPLNEKKGNAYTMQTGKRKSVKTLHSTSINPDSTSKDSLNESISSELKDIDSPYLGPAIDENSTVQPSESLELVNCSYPDDIEEKSNTAVKESGECTGIRKASARGTTQVDNMQIDSKGETSVGITTALPSYASAEEDWEDYSREEEINRLIREDQTLCHRKREFAKAKARAEYLKRKLGAYVTTEEEIPKNLCVEEPQYWSFSENDWKKRVAFEKEDAESRTQAVATE